MNPQSPVSATTNISTSPTSVLTDEALQDCLESLVKVLSEIDFSKIIHSLNYLLKSPTEQRSMGLPETFQILSQIIESDETYTLIEAIEKALLSPVFTEFVSKTQLLYYALTESEVLVALIRKILENEGYTTYSAYMAQVYSERRYKETIKQMAKIVVEKHNDFVSNPCLIMKLEELKGLLSGLDYTDLASSEIVFQSGPLAKIRETVNSECVKLDTDKKIFSILNTPEIRGKILTDEQLLFSFCESYMVFTELLKDPAMVNADKVIKQIQISHPALIVKKILGEIIKHNAKINELGKLHIFIQQIKKRYEEQTGFTFNINSSSALDITNLVHDMATQEEEQLGQTPLTNSGNISFTNEPSEHQIARDS